MSTEAATTSSKMRLRHHGEGGELFVIFIVNLFLKIVTLGIYHFWAKTRIRRYLWTHASFDGERFEYTGRGMELFIGFLKAMGVLILIVLGFIGLYAALAMIDRSLVSVAVLLMYATFFYLNRRRHLRRTPLYVEPYPLAQHTLRPNRFSLYLR